MDVVHSCRCCLRRAPDKNLTTPYTHLGTTEIYSHMLKECFEIHLTLGGDGECGICSVCVDRLRDACDFKLQVQRSQAELQARLGLARSVKDDENAVKLEIAEDDGAGNESVFDVFHEEPIKFEMDNIFCADPLVKSEMADGVASDEDCPSGPGDETSPTDSDKQVTGLKTGGLNRNEEKFKKARIDIDLRARKKNAMLLLEFTKICPFRWMKNLYLCFYCDNQFNDPAWLRTHNENEHSVKTTAQIKSALSKLKKFELAKVDVTNTVCAICDDVLTDFNELKQHLMDKHSKNIDLESNNSVLPFRVTKNDFKCAICCEAFAEFKSLNQHMNVHYQNFICEQCGTGFITPERLRTHGFSHETGSFPCDACEKVFRSTNAKNEHYALVHKRVKRHRCPHCPETFRNYFQRNKHVSTIHGLKLKEFKCNLCPKVFTLSGKLGVHINTVHLKLKRHSCEVCEWKFYSKSELKEHMIRHGGERKHQCSVCKKSYTRKYTLREHMRIHENDRRFVCAT